MILVPLLVMLLLTFLVGSTAYQQSSRLEKATASIGNNVNALLILKNLRWNLHQAEQEMLTQPQQATLTWKEIQRQIMVWYSLSKMLHNNEMEDLATPQPMPEVFRQILLQPEPSQALIQLALKHDIFRLNLDAITQFTQLQQEAQQVTQIVTYSMIALGLLLTSITAYDLERLFRQLADSRDLNIKIQEEERRRIAQDLHDDVVQSLIDLKRHYQPQKLEQVIHTLRHVCNNLKPQILEDLGLPAALEFLADDLRQSGIAQVRILLDEHTLAQLPTSYALPLFRVMQELCANIKKHAHASRVQIRVAYNPIESPWLSGAVQDNGIGFTLAPKASTIGHMGLTAVQERIHFLGGQLKIQSQPGQGSQFHFTIPVNHHVSIHPNV